MRANTLTSFRIAGRVVRNFLVAQSFRQQKDRGDHEQDPTKQGRATIAEQGAAALEQQ
jgi:hypothetical protein